MQSYPVCSGPTSQEIEKGRRVTFQLQGYGALLCDITSADPGQPIKGINPGTGKLIEIYSYNPDTQTGEAILY